MDDTYIPPRDGIIEEPLFEIRNLSDVVYEQGVERIGAIVDVVYVHPDQPIYAQEGIQFVGICDQTLPEGKVYYHTGAVIDPFLAMSLDSLTFEVFRDIRLKRGVYADPFFTSVNRKTLSDEEISRGVYFLPLTRDDPSAVETRYSGNFWEPGFVPPTSVMSLLEEFPGEQDDTRRAHLRQTGWLAGSDIFQITARLNDRKQVVVYGSVDRYMGHQYNYIQRKARQEELLKGMRIPASRSAKSKIFQILLNSEGMEYYGSD